MKKTQTITLLSAALLSAFASAPSFAQVTYPISLFDAASRNYWNIALTTPQGPSGSTTGCNQAWKKGSNWTVSNISDACDGMSLTTMQTFYHPEFFYAWQASSTRKAARMVAIAGGANTGGTAYSRTELREMKADTTNAAWKCNGDNSSTDISRSMAVDTQLVYMPSTDATTKQSPYRVVLGQIHAAVGSDLLEIMYEGDNTKRLWAQFNGSSTDVETLDSSFKVGDRIWFQVDYVKGGNVKVQYRNLTRGDATPSVTSAHPLTHNDRNSGCYFKAGLYLQFCSDKDKTGNTSNAACQTKPASQLVPSADDYAAVDLWGLRLTNPGQ